MIAPTKTVTLRAAGWDRWLTGTLMSFAFLPWLLAESVLVSLLLSATLPIRVPEVLEKFVEGAPPPGEILFALGIVTLIWTLAGYGMLATILRLFLGRDEIEMMPQGLRVRRSIGPFGSTRELAKEDIHLIAIPHRLRQITVKTSADGAKSVVIASLGTKQQQRELAAELVSRYRATPMRREEELPRSGG